VLEATYGWYWAADALAGVSPLGWCNSGSLVW
jgi:hypothetical protein